MAPRLEFVGQTGSTNADLIARLANGELLQDQHWLVADRQSDGKGRLGRSWLDGADNFMGSVAVQLYEQGPAPATLSFVAALAVYETVVTRLTRPQTLLLKWPNDLLLDDTKFSGILLERAGNHAIIGIGVNLADAPDVPGRKVGSLADKGPAPARDEFAFALAETMATEIRRWREFGFEPMRNRWLIAAHPSGTPLTVSAADGTSFSGTFEGLTADGALQLRLEDGVTHVMHAGDVELEAR